ncbi:MULTISPECIES: ketopantoate reductase family protein [unclassified Tatumella]|uniref:ketopantoate reductase family protein n=1 Tax=unclassified Tatumella TaxID=2649542 RepID=UPI001BB0AF5F|nr:MULTISPECIES: ketopantoate reductase family protein [unclassified Tatumella]MBS0878376.1 ketopantoate reductase family protein [Tatumella sp. JGM82]MBS0891172.1 ketopantoate reductase family protein [Tatumella sp. JGM94]MBS0902729.1 ketopantoate reductase family protein [Tatumella sp. JGM100]
MRILVVGAGSTGGYFGACLARHGRDVTFLVRGERAKKLRQQGLVIHADSGTFTLQPNTLLATEITTPYDLIIITVKSFALPGAITDLRAAAGEHTLILPVLNGMQHIDTLRREFGDDKVIGGLCKIHATLNDKGEVLQMSPLHQLCYGELDGSNTSRIQQLDQLLSGCGFDNRLSSSVQSDLWEKWLLLSTLGAVTCLSRGNTRQILTSAGGETLLNSIFSEVLAVITASGYRQRPAIIAAILQTLSNPETPMTSSMYRDLQQGALIEAEPIIGDLVDRARQHAITVPLLNAVFVNLQVYLRSRQAES